MNVLHQRQSKPCGKFLFSASRAIGGRRELVLKVFSVNESRIFQGRMMQENDSNELQNKIQSKMKPFVEIDLGDNGGLLRFENMNELIDKRIMYGMSS